VLCLASLESRRSRETDC